MRLKFAIFLAAAALFAFTAPVWAHHTFGGQSESQYDSKDLVSLTGTIKSVDWTNPHVYVHLDVKDAAGKVTTWALEGYPPNTLKRNGFVKDDLVVGDTVTITAYRAKDGSNAGSGREVTFRDGTKKLQGPASR